MRAIRRIASRLLSIYKSATTQALASGRDWYRKARLTAWDLAHTTSNTLRTSAGVIAALSPRLTWKYNIIAARKVLSKASSVPGVFRASLAKARAIVGGQSPESVLSGPKVLAFYRALTGDESAAVVDVWVARAAKVKSVNPRSYKTIAQALELAAQQAGIPTAQFQASVWCAIRGRAA